MVNELANKIKEFFEQVECKIKVLENQNEDSPIPYAILYKRKNPIPDNQTYKKFREFMNKNKTKIAVFRNGTRKPVPGILEKIGYRLINQ